MDNLPKDALFSIAIELDLPELLAFCGTNKRFNNLICKQDYIWLYKLKRDFPNWEDFPFYKSPKNIYGTLYSINKLKEMFNITGTLLEFYNLRKLDLSRKDLQKIPKEIGYLDNLELLSLEYNKIKEIPKEIGNLKNLEVLRLENNYLTELPKEIGNLDNLVELSLFNNQLTELPKEIGYLESLETLLIFNNKLRKLPITMSLLQNLKFLSISGNPWNKRIKEKDFSYKFITIQ